MLKEKIVKSLCDSISLADAQERLLLTLSDFTSEQKSSVGYVAGIISSDGPEQIEKNAQTLRKYTDLVAKKLKIPCFSCVNVFGDTGLWERFEGKYQNKDWIHFWRGVIYEAPISSIILTPRWKISTGATDEFQTAQARRIGIFELTENLDLIKK